jgi:hypothetical protein
MDAIQDFEDFLELLDRHAVRYLIIGGLAFIFHARPRFTKDIERRREGGRGRSGRSE